MLPREENELITKTGPGTPMGEMMRRYWIPALLSEEIPEPDCEPKHVRLLGEDLVAFRDTQGRIGLLDEYCPHRGVSLAYGRNEEGGLRCIYHGWKLDADGKVLETPAEPPGSTLKDKVKHRAYPTREAGDVVWAYLGPPDKMPAFPEFEWTKASKPQRSVCKVLSDCNYFQGVEGSIDSSHLNYLHSSEFSVRSKDHAPQLTDPEDTPYGFRYAAIRKAGTESYIRITHFVAPFHVIIPPARIGGEDVRAHQTWVPMDDNHHYFYNFQFNKNGPFTRDYAAQFELDANYRPARNRQNKHRQDREAMKAGNFTGIEGIRSQDIAIVE
ncbi:MAG: Rieske 2Fe-2S domain-containing protein, partial [Deltaproteobacteria bacterium]|nr:Rieske 2Fe-2S domain-containing protein [Deltaproteobacteria bacterium]